MGVVYQRHVPAALPLVKIRATLFTGGLIGTRDGLDGCGKSLSPLGFNPRTVQSVASRYTDWAIRARTVWCKIINIDIGENNVDVQIARLYPVLKAVISLHLLLSPSNLSYSPT